MNDALFVSQVQAEVVMSCSTYCNKILNGTDSFRHVQVSLFLSCFVIIFSTISEVLTWLMYEAQQNKNENSYKISQNRDRYMH
jgi:hypothetical protein